MVNYEDVENIIQLLDNKMGDSGINRINLHVEDTVAAGEVAEVYHHGRCDVGSPWARGTIGNATVNDVDSCS